MKNKELGFDKENILVIPLTDENARANYAIFKQKLYQLPEVVSVAGSSNIPYNGFTRNGYFPERADSPYYFHVVDVDDEFLKTFDIKLIKGRNFSPEFPADKNGYLINETLAKTMSWNEPSSVWFIQSGVFFH